MKSYWVCEWIVDNAEKKVKSSYFDLPAMNVFIAFPQATPASKFPTCSKDFFQSIYIFCYVLLCFCFNLCVCILYYSFRLLSFQWTIDSRGAGCAEESEGVHGERSCPHYDRGLSIFVFVCLLWYYHCVTSSFFLWFLLINTGRRQSFRSISFQSLEL